MMYRLLISLFLLFPLLLAPKLTLGQKATDLDSRYKTSIVWSPPDKSFTVRVPEKLKKDGSMSTQASGDIVETFQFGVDDEFILFTMTLRYKDYLKESTEEKFGGLFFVLGGDNNFDFSERSILVDGMKGQQILYDNQKIKGIFVDAGDSVYVLGFVSWKKENLNSNIARNFFSSFKLNRNFKFRPNDKTTTPTMPKGDPPKLIRNNRVKP